MKTTNWMNRIAGKLKSYHNSVTLQDAELEEANEKAKTQDEQVLAMIQMYDGLRLITPNKIHELLIQYYPKYAAVPETSVRRSFTNLKKAGHIEKTGEKVTGNYGAKINVWRLKK